MVLYPTNFRASMRKEICPTTRMKKLIERYSNLENSLVSNGMRFIRIIRC